MLRAATFLVLAAGCASAGLLNPAAVDPSLFTVTTFASGQQFPASLAQLPDGSLAVDTSPGITAGGALLRFTSLITPGVADGPGTALYTQTGGPMTGLVKVGNFYAVSNNSTPTITLLQPGANPGDAWTPVATLNFNFPNNWEHSQLGMAARSTGTPGVYDLVFNIGAEGDTTATPAADQVGLSGSGFSAFPNTNLHGDSVYAITIDETGAQPAASNVRTILTGIRNVFGMQFQAGTGNFYFVDNAMDLPLTNGEPPQADELNWIPAAQFGNGTVPNFGFPTCYIQYVTGTPIGSGCVQPLVAFQPIPDSFAGHETEGPTEIAFAPASFPAGFNNGLFIGFAGEGDTGPQNDEAGLVYYSFDTGQYVHFIESGRPDIGKVLGVMSTANALFITDSTGNIFGITAAAAPEPGSCSLMVLAGLWLLVSVRLRRRPVATQVEVAVCSESLLSD